MMLTHTSTADLTSNYVRLELTKQAVDVALSRLKGAVEAAMPRIEASKQELVGQAFDRINRTFEDKQFAGRDYARLTPEYLQVLVGEPTLELDHARFICRCVADLIVEDARKYGTHAGRALPQPPRTLRCSHAAAQDSCRVHATERTIDCSAAHRL